MMNLANAVSRAALITGVLVNSPYTIDGAAAAPPRQFASSDQPRRPNVVVIVADDQGFGDVGFNGNRQVDTPVLDALSRRGVVLDQFHVSPVCSPTRASLLTGRDSLRTGVWSVTRGGEAMRPSEMTLAEAFSANGYATAAFGKWHNGAHFPSDPNGQGFQLFDGFVEGHSNYWNARLVRNGRAYRSTGFLPDLITRNAIRYIKQKRKRPFLLYLTFNSPHSPFEPPTSLFQKYKGRGLKDSEASVYALVEDFDRRVGRVLQALRESGKEQDSIVVYLSDNGPVFPDGMARYNAGLKGSKGSVDEGGTRVPFIAHWPGHIEGGRRVLIPAQHIDLYPTLLELTGISAPPGPAIDGRSLARVLLEGVIDPALSGRRLFTHHFRNTRVSAEQAIQATPGAVREGRWLATVNSDNRWALYDLDVDPSQTTNLATANSPRLAEMRAAYVDWYADVSRGAGVVQPVELGLIGHDRVELPAHEASLSGTGIAYNVGAGWAHDWVSHWTSAAASMEWLVHVNRPGMYRVKVAYAAPARVAGSRLAAHFGTSSVSAILLHAPPSKPDWGRRTFFTDEAPERKWAIITLGVLPMQVGTERLSLRALEIPHGIVGEVKSILVERVGVEPAGAARAVSPAIAMQAAGEREAWKVSAAACGSERGFCQPKCTSR